MNFFPFSPLVGILLALPIFCDNRPITVPRLVSGRRSNNLWLKGRVWRILYAVQSGDGPEQEMVTQLLGKNVGAANGDYVGVACSRTGIAATIHGIAKTFAGSKLTFKRIVFRLMQMEENWNEYYNIVRLPQDLRTSRFDQPDFTNLSSGYGLFGACTVDSLVHEYPADFRYNH